MQYIETLKPSIALLLTHAISCRIDNGTKRRHAHAQLSLHACIILGSISLYVQMDGHVSHCASVRRVLRAVLMMQIDAAGLLVMAILSAGFAGTPSWGLEIITWQSVLCTSWQHVLPLIVMAACMPWCVCNQCITCALRIT